MIAEIWSALRTTGSLFDGRDRGIALMSAIERLSTKRYRNRRALNAWFWVATETRFSAARKVRK
jgi:hypothetical protein